MKLVVLAQYSLHGTASTFYVMTKRKYSTDILDSNSVHCEFVINHNYWWIHVILIGVCFILFVVPKVMQHRPSA